MAKSRTVPSPETEIPGWMISTFGATKQTQTEGQWRATLATVPEDIRSKLDNLLSSVPNKIARAAGDREGARRQRRHAFLSVINEHKIDGKNGGTVNVRRFIDAEAWGVSCATGSHWSAKSEGGRFAASIGLSSAFVMEETPDDADTYTVSIKFLPLTAAERAYAAAIEEAMLLKGSARNAHPAMKARSAEAFADMNAPNGKDETGAKNDDSKPDTDDDEHNEE